MKNCSYWYIHMRIFFLIINTTYSINFLIIFYFRCWRTKILFWILWRRTPLRHRPNNSSVHTSPQPILKRCPQRFSLLWRSGLRSRCHHRSNVQGDRPLLSRRLLYQRWRTPLTPCSTTTVTSPHPNSWWVTLNRVCNVMLLLLLLLLLFENFSFAI